VFHHQQAATGLDRGAVFLDAHQTCSSWFAYS
jgi:hypothetical protein